MGILGEQRGQRGIGRNAASVDPFPLACATPPAPPFLLMQRSRSRLLKMQVSVLLLVLTWPVLCAGCGHAFPVRAWVEGQGTASVAADANVHGAVEVKLPGALDPGEMISSVVKPGSSAQPGSVALIDLDGVLLNQNHGGLVPVGDNPLAILRDKLDAAAADPQIVAVLLRINSPGGSVTACDVMAQEVARFRQLTHKPVVASLLDVAASGALLIASEADQIIAHPTTLTGGLGVVFNHYNLQDAMAQLNLVADPVKSGARIDMGTVTGPLDEATRGLLQSMADAYGEHLRRRVLDRRKQVSTADRQRLADGRVILATQALQMHLIDGIGYLDDAIATAERLSGRSGLAVVIHHRKGYPAHSVYSITPSPTQPADALPFSYPGLDRAKLPSFLYLWQPDPTLPRLGSR